MFFHLYFRKMRFIQNKTSPCCTINQNNTAFQTFWTAEPSYILGELRKEVVGEKKSSEKRT
jgi:hypothetical protein